MIVSDLNRVAARAARHVRAWSCSAFHSIKGNLKYTAAAAFALAFAASALAAVGVNKSFLPNSVTAGQVSTLTLVFINSNAAPATGTAVTDTLPANVVIANPLTVGTNTCGFAVVATPGTQPIVLSGGTVPGITGGAPGQCTLTIDVVSSIPDTYLNLIPANSITSSQGTNSQNVQATLVVSAPANVTGSKVFVPGNVHGSQTGQVSFSRLTITLTNPNAIPLTGAAITDSMPTSITIATPSNATTTCGAGTATASAPATSPATLALAGGTIPANGSCTIAVDVVARNPLIFQDVNTATNTIPVNALTTTEGARSPAISAGIRVQTGASITKSFSPNPIPPGGTTVSTMTIVVNNWNATPLTPITFTDTFPANMTLAGVPTTTCTGTLSTVAGPPSSVTLTGATLAGAPAGVGATSCTITVPVFATASGNNVIAANNFGGVASAGGNSTLNITPISGSKSFTTPAFQTGQTTMTLTLRNVIIGAAATITTITDDLTTMGAGFTVAAGAVPGGTCGSTLTSPTPGTLITLIGGTIPAGGTCTITLLINIAANSAIGNRTNTIAVNGAVTSLGNNLQTITGQVNVERALTMAKAFVPANVQAGAVSRLTVTLTRRANAAALTNIAFTDSLTTMAGATFLVANPAVEATTCTGGTVAATPGANSFSLAGGSLAAGAAATTCTVSVNVQTPAAGAPNTYTNTIAANAVTTTQGVTNAAVTGSLVLSPSTTVTVNKAFLPTIVAVNGTSVMSVQVRNNNAGAIALTGVGFTDNLPAGMIIANPPVPTFTGTGCSIAGGSITAPNGGSIVTVTNATVNANSICTLSVTVRATASGFLINTIPPNAVSSAQGVSNPLLGSATLGATGTVNLTVTKTNGVTSVTPGGTTTYTIGVSNAGPNDVAGLSIDDTPPVGVTFGAWTCVATGGASCGSGSGPILDTVTISNGGSITYTVPATIAPGAVGTLTNTVNVIVPGSVINTGGSSASDTDTVVPVTSLAITKDDGSTMYLPGGSATYVMVLTNGGPSDATNVNITDTLPAGVTQNGSATCVAVGAGAICGTISNLGSGFSVSGAYVPAGGGASLAYSLPVNFGVGMSAPTITNTVNATNTASSGAGSTASASDTNSIILLVPTLGKSIVPATIAAGGTATLTITLGNPNAAATTLTAAFTDIMPSGVTTTSGNTGTCTGVTVNATSITMASGSSVPAGACTIIVAITSTTPGTVTNTTGSLQTGVGSAAPASAPITVTATAPTLAKSIAPATISAGGTATLTITVGNSNAVPVTLSAPFTDAMPAGVTTTSANSGTCTPVTVAASLITLPSGSTVPAGGCTIVVTITSTTPGTVTNTTSTLQTAVGTAAAASAPLTVNAVVAELGKTIVPATISAGGTATLTLTLGNTNATPQALTAAFTDSMPAGVTTTSANTGTCSAITVTPTTITMPAGTDLPPGGCTIVVTITSTTPGAVLNTTSTLTTAAGVTPAASAPLTVNEAPPTLLKSILPATIVSGGTSTLTITVGNPNATAITLTAPFTDPMPAGVTTTSANTGTCTPVTVASALLTLPSGSIIPVGGCTIIVTVTSATPGTVTNTTSTIATGAGTSPAASAPLTVTAVASALGKTILPSSIVAGTPATLTITLSNTNATPLTLTAPFTDAMPAGVTTTSANSGTCTGVTVAATLITVATGATIAPGGCTIIVMITSSTPGTVTNTTSTLETGAGTSSPASAPLTVTPATAGLTKVIAPATIGLGGSATLTLTLGNINTTLLTLTAPFTDPMPAGVTTTSANTGSCIGVTVTPTLITMAAGSTVPSGGCTIVVTITSLTPGAVTNTTSTVQTGAGTTPPASAPLTVTSSAAALSKTIVPATIAVGGTATLTITLANANAGPLTLAAPFTGAMPAGVSITSVNTGTCTGVTTTVLSIIKAAGTTVPVGGCTIIVTITSSTPGTVTNITSALQTSGGTTPAASAPLTVTNGGSPLTKTIAPATIAPGGTATLTLALGNATALPLTLTAAFTDTMPAGVTITSGNTGSCTGVTVASTMITKASGTTIPPGGCTIVVSITSSTPGTVLNTTSALDTNAGTTPPASAPLTVTAGAAALTKSIAPATIAPGGTATLTLALGNPTAAPLTLTAPFSDAMPAGVTTTSGNTGTCTGVTVTTATITKVSGSTIPPGGCTIVVTITSSTPGTVTNTTGPLQTNGGTVPPASAPITVVVGAITLNKSFNPATIDVGTVATLTLVLGNTGVAPVVLTAPFTDPMPAGLTITSPHTGTCPGVTVTPTVITMATGSSIPPGGCTIIVGVVASAAGSFINVTGVLATSGGSAPPATAPVLVKVPTPPSAAPIPVNSPLGLALLLLALGGIAVWQFRRASPKSR